MNKRTLLFSAACPALFACQTARPILATQRPEAARSAPTLFEGVRLFDGNADELSAPADLLVDEGRIAAIAPQGQLADPRALGARRVSGRGRTLLPGLIDCHVHLGGGDGAAPWDSKFPNTDAQAAALVYSGVTKPRGYSVPGFPPSDIESLPGRAPYLRANAKRLFDAGAKLVAGTDSGLPEMFHGAALHRELQALAALGIPPARALRMATADAAKALDPRADYGEIKVGLRADLLLVEGDPLVDITATERIVGAWQDGRELERSKR